MPYTLSHALNPTLREYRRASSTAIDASLKPLMTSYLDSLDGRLREAGFGGRLLMVTSSGGVVDAADMGAAPIHSINSGPAMAPIAGRHYAALDGASENAVVADTGGTSYDVTLVRRGRIPVTRETWLGLEYEGHITGFPAVDVRSVGAGGGSIAWIDDGGLLHVGPQSAGADPGPVCYGRGGGAPTVTDACVVLGYIDPDYFLGGTMELDAAAARRAIDELLAQPLGLTVEEAAAAIMAVATERMVQAIEEITVNQGVDPRSAVLVGGGGAAGLNAVAIARRLGSRRIVIPQAGAVLSARGALMTRPDERVRGGVVHGIGRASTTRAPNAALAELRGRCEEFAQRNGSLAEPRDRVHRRGALPPPGVAARRAAARGAARVGRARREPRRGLPRDPRGGLRGARRARGASRSSTCARASTAGCAAAGRTRSRASSRATRRPGMRGVYFSGVGKVDAAILRLEAMAPGAAVRGAGDRRVVVHDDRAEPGRERRARGERQPRDRAGARSTRRADRDARATRGARRR